MSEEIVISGVGDPETNSASCGCDLHQEPEMHGAPHPLPLSSRSRMEEFHDCPRLRYLAHEAFGTGYEPVGVSVPLVTGGAAHVGFAGLLSGRDLEEAVSDSLSVYDAQCKDRQFDLADLAAQSYTYQEQRALVEALVRLAGLRIVPQLLAQYEILEVERMDTRRLGDVTWRSIPDALMRDRQTDDLVILSWKTTADYNPKRKEKEVRTDTQGISEAWTIQERLDRAWDATGALRLLLSDSHAGIFGSRTLPPRVSAIQMVYVLKGEKREVDWTDASGNSIKVWAHQSPLIRGYVDPVAMPSIFAAGKYWRCSAPHPMRKSQWYPNAECPGNGRRHEHPDSLKPFCAWETLGVRRWMEILDGMGALGSTLLPYSDGYVLNSQFVLPVPIFRDPKQEEKWRRQTEAEEGRIQYSLSDVRRVEASLAQDADWWEYYDIQLDSSFPQNRRECSDHFGRDCPMYAICWGPEHIARDPVASGLYQVRKGREERGK